MALHRGAVDWAPLAGKICSPATASGTKIADSHAMQIHASDAVVIRRITAFFTPEQMETLAPIALFCVPTGWTPLTGICWVNLNNLAASPDCLIFELLTQVIEGSADGYIALLRAYPLCGRSDTSQVFQHKQGVLRVVFHECL